MCTTPKYAAYEEGVGLHFKLLTSWSPSVNPPRFVEAKTKRGGSRFLPLMAVACRQCLSCRLSRAQGWAVRCMHERIDHPSACFLTMTYDDKHLPGQSLVKDEMAKFFKRLRKNTNLQGLKYLYCGEYGSSTRRPHYHAILFGTDFFEDRKFYKRSYSGHPLFNSPALSDAWQYRGHAVIGSVTFDSAAYVARYVVDKVNGAAADDHYSVVDASTGEVISIIPEFAVPSRRPGLGNLWIQQHWRHVAHLDGCVSQGSVVPVPEYYNKWIKANQPDAYNELVERRIAKARERQFQQESSGLFDKSLDRLRVKLQFKKAYYSRMVRELA